jgi:hypothetical protein
LVDLFFLHFQDYKFNSHGHLESLLGWFDGCELLLRHPQIQLYDQKLKNILHRVSVMTPKTLTQITQLDKMIELILRKGIVYFKFENDKQKSKL